MLFALVTKLFIMAFIGALFFVFSGAGKNDLASTGNYLLNKYLARAEPDKNFVSASPPKPVYATMKSPPPFQADSVYVGDVRSGGALKEEMGDEPFSIASLTKLMTALIAAEHGFDPEEAVTITADDRVAGNVEYFFPGDRVRLKDLLAASLLASSNTAAKVLAKYIGGDKFTELMNERARLLALKNTRFTDPTGINPGNISTAREVARLAVRTFARPEIADFLTKPTYEITVLNTGRKIELKNTNRLLGGELDRDDYKIIGGKTGFIDESGYNLALRVARGGDEIIVVVLGSGSKAARFLAAKSLALWAFGNFKWQ